VCPYSVLTGVPLCGMRSSEEILFVSIYTNFPFDLNISASINLLERGGSVWQGINYARER
jgi:hypothetical protein